MKTVFISGITGTLGQTVCRMLLARGGCRVVGYSRDEQKQSSLPQSDGLTLYLGDIRDKWRLVEATRGADIIMHFAALKMVDKLEENPEEAVETNVVGTNNILHAQRINKVPRVVLASTDKAVYPINAYGMSKGLAERLVLRNPNNVVCRYGNVLGSRGSVLPMFVKSLRSPEPHANVTHLDMTRFWITAERAAGFVIGCAFDKSPGLKIPPIEAAPVTSVVEALATHLGIPSYDVYETGIRPGEKLHECLQTPEENDSAIFSDDSEMPEESLKMLIGEAMRGIGG